MKLLLVIASALLLVAHGNVIPSEVDDGPQGVFDEEAPAVHVFGVEDESRVSFSQEPLGAYAAEEPVAESVPAPETGIYIPIASRACNNAVCNNICHRLGYRHGICISPRSCLCSK